MQNWLFSKFLPPIAFSNDSPTPPTKSFSPSNWQIKTLPTLYWNVSFLRFETEINGIASFPKKNVVIIYMHCGLFMHIHSYMYCGGIVVLVFGLGIPKGCSTILWNFQRWRFAFSRIFKDNETNLKIPGIFLKKYVSTTPCLNAFLE